MIAAGDVTVEDRLRIEDLYARYAAVLDDQQYDEWPAFFTEDAVYKVIPRENYDRGLPLSTLAFESRGMLEDRVYGITQTLFHEPYYQRHLICGLLVRRDDEAFAVRANYCVVRTKKGMLSEVYSAGRYDDRIVEDGGQLRFARKLVIFDSELIPNSLIYPL
ncbi:MAG: aromatic-ring-hydroxylating dioxygenase subunit beta [Candidatus Eremiobacteraeota bacterium]|nr:aromatic-ring-hydroxylating dioxygenase subunit beta [Candidatus Eremiobacteraeota bacterium]